MASYKIVIVDYGMGNFGSVLNMVKHIGYQAEITRDPKQIEKADRLILAGVGAFDNGMNNLESFGLIDVLNNKVINSHTPILGICLGMQLFTNSSEEGERTGLGWVDASTIRFDFDNITQRLKIPHMGWNIVSPNTKVQGHLIDIQSESRFYFIHSYYVKCNDSKNILLSAEYGFKFTAAIRKKNIIGVQFHPEKSHKFGMTLLKNFIEETP